MSAATQMPTWAVFAVTFGTPILAFLGAIIGHLVSRRSAKELDKRSRREELMKTLQWAAELAISEDQAKARLGLRELQTLSDSYLSDPEVQAFVDAALEAVVAPVADELEQDPDAEIEPVTAVRNAGIITDADGPDAGRQPVQSDQESDERGGGSGQENLRHPGSAGRRADDRGPQREVGHDCPVVRQQDR
jgi:hypothetical protein